METALDIPLFDQPVALDHLAWSRDANWLLHTTPTAGSSDIAILFIDQQVSETLTSPDTNDYSPDLFDPQFCTIHTDDPRIRVRVGPGLDRGIFGYFPADQNIRAISQTHAADGSLWWEIDRTLIDNGHTANSLWVSQDAVLAARRCRRLPTIDAPPLIAGQSNNNTSTGQWGFCGSCSSCGPHPTSECVTSPDGVCLWDPTTCRNITVVTDPNLTPIPGQNCFFVSMNFRSTDGSPVSPTPAQSVNTAPTCNAGAGFSAGTVVSIATSDLTRSGSLGYEFDHWEGTCGASGGSSTTINVNATCLATAVYRPVVIVQ
jgi:hypothetical protein